MKKLRLLDLFSGIGGFSLGLERSGAFATRAFCEIDPFCRRVLARHWPDIPRYDDVRILTADALRRDGIAVDAICGGFPCQDISLAGKGAGLDGKRSGLWREYARLVRELRPRFVLVENVAALLGRGMGVVLGELSALGYDAVWRRIAAADLGAPHLRQRIWIVAYARGVEHEEFGDALWRQIAAGLARAAADAEGEFDGLDFARADDGQESELGDRAFAHGVSDADGEAWRREARDAVCGAGGGEICAGAPQSRRCGRDVADALGEPGRTCGPRDAGESARGRHAGRGGECADMADAGLARLPPSERAELCRARRRHEGRAIAERSGRPAQSGLGRMADGLSDRLDAHPGWLIEPPGLPRVARGVPERVGRLKGLGNAVVPQIPELIGRAIADSLERAP